METSSYKDKYKELKRKFKALQNEHLKLSSQYDISMKSIKLLKREISFMDEKTAELQKKSGKPYKKAKTEDNDDSAPQT
ncbi:hypothetical protein SteCoe_27430 [Stentor coeruleus]|uniref:Uncharacterized protein n=1 Tax=Stentor coeruleus TaxID=5963 RepID=A0A1R2BAP0_9CILI|nr:hypothetical protein SteCoe_27430 [Stentor coeruleus]